VEPLGGAPNAVFEVINEYQSVLSGVQVQWTKLESEPPLWPKLLIRSHQVAMSAFHLAVGGLLQESGALMRVSIELFTHARYIEENPYLAHVWLCKNDPSIKKQYERLFEQKKADRLFAGVPELHRHFGFWSELGAHSNANSLWLHGAPNPLEVSAQTDDLEVINEILLHLLSTCLCMADLAKAYVKIPISNTLEVLGRQKRLASYQPQLQRLTWTLKDPAVFGRSR
jgi:hypothetical protein